MRASPNHSPERTAASLTRSPLTWNVKQTVNAMAYPHRCPTCIRGLDLVDGTGGQAWTCPTCLGTAAKMGLLQEHMGEARASSLASSVVATSSVSRRRCPACDAPMRTFWCQGRDSSVELDVCRACDLVWFDHVELEQMGVLLSSDASSVSEALKASAPVVARTASAGASGVSNVNAAFSFLEIITWFFG